MPLAEVAYEVGWAIRTLRAGEYHVWNGAKAVSVQELVMA